MMDATEQRGDAELVAAVLAGDRKAFNPLLARWQPSSLRLCRRLLGPGPQAEDVAQEAAVAAFLGLARLADPVRFGAWLQAIAANRARMALRRRHRLTLEGLPPHMAEELRAGEPVPTPEDAWASREIHHAILAALRKLPPATREVVIGFYLQGYSYHQLAELLGAPLSTVRGRLYHGRRQLRQMLRPLAEEVLTPAPTRREEQPMDPTALIDVDVAFVGRLAFSTDCVVMLQEQGGPRRLALEGVDAATGAAVERLVGGDQPLARPPTTCFPAWSPRSAAGSGKSPSAGWSARRCMPISPWTAAGGDPRSRPGRTTRSRWRCWLARRSGVAAAVMEVAGFDPNDRQQERIREEQELERLRQRVAERAGPPPPSPIPPPPPLDTQVRRRVEDCLERLRADLGGWLALLTHDSGTLVAWAGPGDPAAMARYCQARADRDPDLTHLLLREVYPPDQVEAVVFRSVGRLWRVEVGITAEEAEQERERFAHRSDQAVQELETLLRVSTAAARLSGPDEPSGSTAKCATGLRRSPRPSSGRMRGHRYQLSL
jgi:RNA polymerase sigma-70 factor, ECF subfamily